MESSIARIEPIRSRSGGDRRIGRSKGGRRSQGPLLDSPSMPRRLSLHPPMLGSRRSRCFTFQTGLVLIAIAVAGWCAIGCTRLDSPLDAGVLRFDASSSRPISGPASSRSSPPATANLGDDLRTAWPAHPDRERDLLVDLDAVPGASEQTGLREVELRFAFGVADPLPSTTGEEPPVEGDARRDSVRFVVEQVADGEAEVLFSKLLTGATFDDGFDRWHEGSVTLPPALSGQPPERSPARFRFRSEASPDSMPSRPAYWGDVHLSGVAPPRPRSILLISIDTLRADRLSVLGRRDRETTPRIDAWARRHATVFSDAVAASPWTLPSHASIFSGLEALHHGINRESNQNGVRFAGEGRDFPYLAELLRDGGLRTGASVGGGLLAPQFGFAAGFDVYRWSTGAQSDRREIQQGAKRALAWLRAHQDEPSFFFLHTYRVHSPFDRDNPEFAAMADSLDAARDLRPLDIEFLAPLAEEGHRNDRARLVVRDTASSKFLPYSDLRALNDAYDAGVLSADAVIGDLLQAIESEGLDQRLTIIITSDHGEALGESGRFGHHDLHEPTISVPLLLAVPGGQSRMVSTQVRHVDILPTILEAAGVLPPATLDGVSLLPFASGQEVAIPNLAWSYSGGWNQGLSLRAGGRFKFFIDDTAWEVPGRARIVGHDLVSDPAESSARKLIMPAQGSATTALLGREFEALRSVATEALASGTGLWLHLVNRSQAPLELRLAGSGILPDGLKAAPTEGLVVRWVKMGHAAVTLAPGRNASLRLTRPFHHRLRLELGQGLLGGESHTFTVEELGMEPVLVHGPGGWRRVQRALEPGETGLAFEWIGPIRRTVGQPPAARDSATEEQLRALGYVT